MTAAPTPRMSAEDRREQVLGAATTVFARTGYAGTSTDAVARAAGVSQPYVVRMFGTKKELFLAVFERAAHRIRHAFQQVLDDWPADAGLDPEDEALWQSLGAAYFDLLVDRDLLLVMMHGFAAGDDADIATSARRCMGGIYDVLRSTGCEAERAVEFVAHGMLLNVMIAMRAPEHLEDSPGLADMTLCAFGEAGVEAAAAS